MPNKVVQFLTRAGEMSANLIVRMPAVQKPENSVIYQIKRGLPEQVLGCQIMIFPRLIKPAWLQIRVDRGIKQGVLVDAINVLSDRANHNQTSNQVNY